MLIMDAGAARAHKLMLRTSRDDLSFGLIPEWNFSEKKNTVRVDFHGIQLGLVQLRLWKMKIIFFHPPYTVR